MSKHRIFVSNGFNLDGTRNRPSKTVETDLTGRDLDAFLIRAKIAFEDEVKKRDPKFDKLSKGSFEAYSIWWMKYKIISDKTAENYQNYLDLRILPFIGKKILSKLTTSIMLELMETIRTTPSERTGEPLSINSVKHYHTLLVGMFNTAMALKILTENPMDGVEVDSPSRKVKDNYYTIEELTELFELLNTTPIRYHLAILLTISTGLRLGELSGLQWKHIDTEHNVILIEQANTYAKKKSGIKDPKNESSVRKISFPRFLNELIWEHEQNEIEKKDLLGDGWYYDVDHKDDYVFTQANGKVIFKDTISDWFRKFRRKHNLREVTFHGLRHTSTTVLISKKINVKNISSRLGHSRTSTTTDIYSHALLTVEQESANIFDDVYTENKEKKESGTEGGTRAPYLRVVK